MFAYIAGISSGGDFVYTAGFCLGDFVWPLWRDYVRGDFVRDSI